MTRLIDADAISWELVDVGYIPVITKEEIDAMPTVDAEPIKYGSWVRIDDFPLDVWECDRCGNMVKIGNLTPFCPYCGAKMEK